jgi:hypothetical protein
MAPERSKGSFEFRADIREVKSEGDQLSFVIGAATDALVAGPNGQAPGRLTHRALTGMRAQGVIPIVSGPNHVQGMSDPFTIIGEGTPLQSPDGEFVVRCELYPKHPHAADLYDKVQRHPEWYKASIGGLIPKDGVSQQIARGADGRSVYERVIDQCPLDHIYFCRARSALDQGTWVAPESRAGGAVDSFAEALFRAAEEVVAESGRVWPDLAVVDELEGRSAWSSEEIDAMPDDHFLFIEPGGTRHLPVKDPAGNWSCPHLANAESRCNQIVLADGQVIGEEAAARLKSRAGALYQEHCAKEGRCAVPPRGAGQGDIYMATATGQDPVRPAGDSVGDRILMALGLGALLHRADDGTADAPPAEAPPAEAPAGGDTPPAPAPGESRAADQPELAQQVAEAIAPVMDGVNNMVTAVQSLVQMIQAGQAPAPEESPAEEAAETPAQEAAEEPAEGGGEEPAESAEDTAKMQQWFDLTANLLQGVQQLSSQVQTLGERLAALEGSRGVSVQPTVPTAKGETHEHRTSTTTNVENIFGDTARKAGLSR